MKQKTITTPTASILVVELPEGKLHGFKITERGNLTFFKYDEFEGSFPIVQTLPEGNWQLLGRLPDITEEQAAELVEIITEFGLPLYTCGKYSTPVALDALHSLLQANEVYFENPYGELEDLFDGTMTEDEMIDLHDNKWQEAQSKLWDKERTFLFIKVD